MSLTVPFRNAPFKILTPIRTEYFINQHIDSFGYVSKLLLNNPENIQLKHTPIAFCTYEDPINYEGHKIILNQLGRYIYKYNEVYNKDELLSIKGEHSPIISRDTLAQLLTPESDYTILMNDNDLRDNYTVTTNQHIFCFKVFEGKPVPGKSSYDGVSYEDVQNDIKQVLLDLKLNDEHYAKFTENNLRVTFLLSTQHFGSDYFNDIDFSTGQTLNDEFSLISYNPVDRDFSAIVHLDNSMLRWFGFWTRKVVGFAPVPEFLLMEDDMRAVISIDSINKDIKGIKSKDSSVQVDANKRAIEFLHKQLPLIRYMEKTVYQTSVDHAINVRDELTARIRDIEAVQELLDGSIDDVSQNIKDTEKDVKLLSKDVKSVKEELPELEKVIKENEKVVKNYDETVKGFEKQVQTLISRQSELNTIVSEIKVDNSGLNSKVNNFLSRDDILNLILTMNNKLLSSNRFVRRIGYYNIPGEGAFDKGFIVINNEGIILSREIQKSCVTLVNPPKDFNKNYTMNINLLTSSDGVICYLSDIPSRLENGIVMRSVNHYLVFENFTKHSVLIRKEVLYVHYGKMVYL